MSDTNGRQNSPASDSGKPSPPSIAAIIVGFVLPRRTRAICRGDLDERFRRIAAKRGEAAARRWYRRQAVGFALRVPAARLAGALRHLRPSEGALVGFSLGRDLGHAVRGLRARPGFAVPSLMILALAVAANTTVLSIVDNVLFRGLPFADADSLVVMWDVPPADDPYQADRAISYRHYLEWKSRSDLFTAVGAMESALPVVRGADYPARVHGMLVSGNLLSMLGATPAMGRLMTPSDDVAGADPVVVISDRLWRSHFGSDPEIIGRAVSVNGASTTVIGVTTAGWWFYDPWMWTRSVGARDTAQPDVWQPLHTRDWADAGWIDYPALRVYARLREGVDVVGAQSVATTLRTALADDAEQPGFGVKLVALEEQVLGDMRPRLLLLQTAVLLVLLIACVNVMSLVLAKSSATRSELAVRAALGASRWSLLRLSLLEGAVLGIGGGGLGLLLARSLQGVVLQVAPRELPLAERVGIDGRVALLTLAVAAGAGMLAGALPGLSLNFSALTVSLRSASRASTGSLLATRARSALVAVEVAVTITLLIGATVMTRSFIELRGTDPGFDAAGVLTFDATLSTSAGQTPDYGFYDRLLADIGQIPGVTAAGSTSHLPFSNWGGGRKVVTDDVTDLDDAPSTEMRRINGDYFGAMHIHMLAGRAFARSDDGSSEPVVVVNQAFAARFLGLGDARVADAVGATVGLVAPGSTPEVVQHRIVGVVANVEHYELFGRELPIAYLPFRQEPVIFQRFAVRSEGDPLALIAPIRRAAAAIDPDQPIAELNTMASLLSQSTTEERFYSSLLGAFGLVAFGLAGVGIYGSVAYGVRLRLREIGVRVAFGACPASIRRLIVGQGMLPVMVGVVAGAAGAAFLVRGLETLLHGVSPLDPTSFLAAATAFVALAAGAAWIPALRASRVDPVETLRAD